MLLEKIDRIRTSLGDVNDDLLALLDDLWLEIDHTEETTGSALDGLLPKQRVL